MTHPQHHQHDNPPTIWRAKNFENDWVYTEGVRTAKQWRASGVVVEAFCRADGAGTSTEPVAWKRRERLFQILRGFHSGSCYPEATDYEVETRALEIEDLFAAPPAPEPPAEVGRLCDLVEELIASADGPSVDPNLRACLVIMRDIKSALAAARAALARRPDSTRATLSVCPKCGSRHAYKTKCMPNPLGSEYRVDNPLEAEATDPPPETPVIDETRARLKQEEDRYYRLGLHIGEDVVRSILAEHDAVAAGRPGAGGRVLTKEQRPSVKYGDQVDVLFGSRNWGWPIVGMYTHWRDKDVSEGACRWSSYDQQNDRFVDWELGGDEEEPEFWMFRPNLPAPPADDAGGER